MKSSIKKHTHFTPTERRGIIGMLFLSSLLIAFIFLYDQFGENHRAVFDYVPDSTEEDITKAEVSVTDVPIKKPSTVKKEIIMRPFDPNTVTKSELTSMNLPAYGINSFLKYRSTGKKFYSIKDFKSVYGFENLSDKLLVKHLILPDKPTYQKIYPKKKLIKKKIDTISQSAVINQKQKKYKSKYDIAPHSINVNTAAAEELSKLKGIASYRSGKIIEYRDAIGGFYTMDQLYEIPQVPDSIITQNLEYFMVDSNQIKSININEWTFDQFRKHPYIGYKKAQLLSRYIKEHGPLHSMNDLTHIIALDSSFIKKISPYLRLD